MSVLLLVPSTLVWAQATASISGTVRDNSGAVLPGVTITATQTDTGATRVTVTNESGAYSLLNLPLGPYRFEASLQGFNTYTQTNLVLQVGSTPVIDPTLGVGAVQEAIEVVGTAPLVNTRTAAIGTVVESARILELPLAGREVTQLVTLSGLAVQQGGNAPGMMRTGVLISVAGGSTVGVSYSLDGAPHLNAWDGTGMSLPFPDALQEFGLVTGAQESSSGNIRSGASVNAVTRSGTNVFHGSLFEFARDSRLNSKDFFSGLSDNLRRHQFGGALGGPIVRDKLFFFGAFQGTTTRQTPNGTTAFLPTAAMRAGDFTAFASPACNAGRQLTLAAPFVNNRLDPALMSPAALKVLSYVQTPTDPCGRVLFGAPLHEDEYQPVVRVDYQKSASHSFLGRYIGTNIIRKSPYDLSGDILTAGTPESDGRALSATFGHTWVIGPTKVNSFRVFGNQILLENAGGRVFGPEDVGVNAYSYVPDYMFLTASGGVFSIMGPFQANKDFTIRNYGVSDDFTLVSGSHEFKFGGRIVQSKADQVENAFSVGQYSFTGQFTGSPLGDLMIGRMGPFTQGTPNGVKLTQLVAGAYVQDTWRRDRVTLNYGVAWNPYFAPNFWTGEVYSFSLDNFNAGRTSAVVRNAPPGFTFPGDDGFNGNSGVNPHYGVVDPNVGFAWDPAGDGRSSVRAGFSMGHDYPQQQSYLFAAEVPPWSTQVVLPAGASLDNPWAGYPGGNPFPYAYNADNPQFPVYSAYLTLPPDLKPTTQYSWNAGYQRQFSPVLFASASYIGTKLTHILGSQELNPALNMGQGPCTLYDATIRGPRFYPVCTVAGNVNQRRLLNQGNPNVALGIMTQLDDLSYQNYNGLLLNTRLNLGRSLNFNANYTLSKCEATMPWTVVQVQPGNNRIHQPYQNNGSTDIEDDLGACPQDRRHIFNLTAVFTSGQYGGVLGALASNWTAASVFQARSGSPVNITTGRDNALNGFFPQNGNPGQRPVIVPGVDPYGDTSGLIGYFNLDAFAQPAVGTYGDTPWNYLLGPGFWQWDQAFTRGFNVANGQRIELRAEIINVTNRFNRGNPSGNLGNTATFGRITTAAAAPRVWQLAVKYNF